MSRSTARLSVVAGAVAAVLLGSLYSFKTQPVPQPVPPLALKQIVPEIKPTRTSAILTKTEATRLPSPELNFVKTPEHDFAIRTETYSARVTPAGTLNFSPLGEDLAGCILSLNVDSISRGKDASILTATHAEPELHAGHSVVFTHAGAHCRELYTPRGEGIEQEFVIDALPGGEGDLKFVVAASATGMKPVASTGRHGGIAFACAVGKTAVRYGQVVVRDAKGQGISVEPQLDSAERICFAIPERWLQHAAFPIVVDPLIGANIGISSSTQQANRVAAPTIAAATGGFLISWVDYSFGADLPVIASSILTQSGLASSPFIISDSLGRPRQFRFQRSLSASDGTNWLVIWSDDRVPGNGIRGCLISSVGAILGGSDFLIATTSGNVEEDPIVVFNGTDFVIAWQDLPPQATTGSQIRITRVTTAGVVAASQVLPSTFTAPLQTLALLSPQVPSGDTLLLYRDSGDTTPQTHGVRIATDGSLRDATGIGLFKEAQADGGYGRPIGAAFRNGAWNILSSYDQTVDSSIFMHKLSTDGNITPPTGVFAEMGLGPTGFNSEPYAPAFAGSDEWLLPRDEKVSNTVYHVLGKRVTLDGQDKDPVPFQIDTASQGVLRTAVAAQLGNYFAVAWVDGRNGTSQPADGVEIVAAIVDTTIAGSTDAPLVAVATASPSSGEAPLTTSFSSALSQGTYDSAHWDFGDGGSSAETPASHTYRLNGTYTAQLTLTKGAYSVYDSVLIRVGTGLSSDAPVQVGVPVQNTDNLVPALFLQSFNVTLNFLESHKDSLQVTGTLDHGHLPTDLTGLASKISIGSYFTSFSLDSTGAHKSDVTVDPQVNFTVVPATGAFVFTVINGDLVSAFTALGATNANVTTKDNLFVTAPFSLTLGSFSATASCGFQYRAIKDNSGAGSYIFQSTGNEVSGSFLVTTFSAKETALKKVGTKIHTFIAQGQLVLPNGAAISASSTGNMIFSIGNYSATLPGSSFKSKKGNLNFAGKKVLPGLTKFSVTSKGKFSVTFTQIPADTSGLPVASSGDNILKADLNLSFQIDLADGSQLSAGRFIFIQRDTAATKTWALRD